MSENFEDNIINNIIENYNICNLSDVSARPGSLALSLFSRVYRQNSRSGSVFCQGRSDLTSRSNKKPWRQKGTGRARAGTPRSPLWRGGAISHGPKFRSKELSIPKKLYRLAMLYVLSKKNAANKIFIINDHPKTSCAAARKLLYSAGLSDKKIILLHESNDYEVALSFSNIKKVGLVSYADANAYSMAMFDAIVFCKKDELLFNSLVKSCQY